MKRNVKKMIASSCTLIALSSWIAPINAVSAAEIPEPLVISTTPEIFNMDVVQTDVPLKQGRITHFLWRCNRNTGLWNSLGRILSTQRRVTVYAYGKERNTRTGNPGTTVRVTAPRAFSEIHLAGGGHRKKCG
ncbi:hypothetical protein NWO25_07700 [Enterococcus lactis]|nr:hypothetical protein [Enterococcus lactis]